MNKRLLDPFQSLQLPDVIEEVLDEGIARSVAFNRRGTILAAGCEDGRIVLWDFETRGVAGVLTGHSQAVTCLEWSRDGRSLVSGSLDCYVKRWKVEDGSQEASFDTGSKVAAISMDEHAANLCVVSHTAGPPRLISFQDGRMHQLPTVSTDSESKSATAASVAVTDRSGSVVYIGQSRGTILTVDSATLQVSDLIKVQGSQRITGLTLNRKGTLLLVLSGDRVIRLYEVDQNRQQRRMHTVDEARSGLLASKGAKSGSLLSSDEPVLQLQREFQDSVERTAWRAAVFTADSEHVIGAAGGSSRDSTSTGHFLYIWEAYSGRLEKVLESRSQSAATALAAHPQRHLLAAVTLTGQIFIWSKEFVENWSAFAPDFKELETNEEYVEREDEFDINERPSSPAAAETNEASETEVDVLGAEDGALFSSDDEGGQPVLHHLPVVIRPQSPPPPPPKVKASAPASSDESGSDEDNDDRVSGDDQRREETPVERDGDDASDDGEAATNKRQKR